MGNTVPPPFPVKFYSPTYEHPSRPNPNN
uniref:Uncharacterized protein n=1 Tax=Rhizophora mucronata TaxID=61149 RepID=A0A2P2Q8J0_RHIMU